MPFSAEAMGECGHGHARPYSYTKIADGKVAMPLRLRLPTPFNWSEEAQSALRLQASLRTADLKRAVESANSSTEVLATFGTALDAALNAVAQKHVR